MYSEVVPEFGVTYLWHNAIIKESIITHRGTKVEMVERPNWGLACYMDNCIQSCLLDEKIYHEALVTPVMSNSIKKVLIIGGGEGATAREVLKWPVEKVDMIEWDRDVVKLFRKYPQWSQGAWDDPRLTVIHEDIFKVQFTEKYDAIIIDLFEPDDKMNTFIKNMNWTSQIIMYAGMNTIVEQPYKKLMSAIEYDSWRGIPLGPNIKTYKIYIPSFSGECVFLHIT